MKPNDKFELNVSDIEIIENALIHKLKELSDENCDINENKIKKIHNLLGKLHQQKIWFRPKDETYISG